MVNLSIVLAALAFIFTYLMEETDATSEEESELAEEETTLLQVQVAFRHGDRTPDYNDFYPNDPYRNMSFYPVGIGELTNSGKIRSYTLGVKLRARYNEFLGDIYDSQILEASSTDFDRTKMSLHLVLAGLWPPVNGQIWNENLPWMPIPYGYRENEFDTWLKRPNEYCPMYMKELNQVLDTRGKEIIKNNSETFEYIRNKTGKDIKTLKEMFHIYQTLLSEDNMGLTLPEWTRTIYPSPIADLASQQCVLENGNVLLRRLNGGNILRKYLIDASDKINGSLVPKGRKMFLYSGHETNVVKVLAALDIFQPHIPAYSSAVMFELHYRNSTQEYGFKIFYDDNINPGVQILKVPGCEHFCPFKKFIRLTENVVPKNYTKECGSSVNIDRIPKYSLF